MPHSKGPWSMSNRNICDASENILFLANTANPNGSADQCLAVQAPDMLQCIDNIEADNARLRTIHAALLEAAEALVDVIDSHGGCECSECTGLLNKRAKDVCTAIALAREGGDDGPAD